MMSTVDLKPGPLKISENQRFLMHSDGTPFFYLADTAWELFHRLNRKDALRYLDNRRDKGFTVIQAVALAEHGGLNDPNAQGDLPLIDNDPTKPAITEGKSPDDQAQYDYWDHVDFIVDEANKRGLTIGLLPTWGDKWNKKWGQGPEIFTPTNAKIYGEWLGKRYRDKAIIWILGGDRPVESEAHKDIIRAMAAGLKSGDGGRHLMTYHPSGGQTSSTWFHNDGWLNFNMQQNGHCTNTDVWNRIERDYKLTPIKPVIDGEPLYEDHPICFDAAKNGYSDAYEIRKFAYWDVFAGAAGHTYGNHTIWQFYAPKNGAGINGPTAYWTEAIDHAGAAQMQYLRKLIEARPYFERVPDQAVLADAKSGTSHLQATRGQSYLFVYAAGGTPFTVKMGAISGEKVNAFWYDPRQGTHFPIGVLPNEGTHEFVPPTNGRDADWVLVLDDTGKKFAPIGPSGNLTPQVKVQAPTQSEWKAPASIDLKIGASDGDGKVKSIELFAGQKMEGARLLAKNTGAGLLNFRWKIDKPGLYSAFARVTDDAGATTLSPVQNFTVGPLQFDWYRALNFNGPELKIDGHNWESAQNAPNFSFTGQSFANQDVHLVPAADEAARAQMLRSSIWNQNGSNFSLQKVPNGTYQIFLYVWEDNANATFDISLQGQRVQQNFHSGAAGEWKKLGPWLTKVDDGNLRVKCSAGDANLSGVEMWKLAD